MERARYTFWDCLGDVGGFHDGIILVLYYIMIPYSAASFKSHFSNDAKYSKKTSIETQQRQQSLANMWQELETPIRVNKLSLSVLKQLFGQIKKVKTQLWCSICACLVRRKRWQGVIKSKMVDRMDKHLDIKNLIETSIRVKLLTSRLLTH